jgi:hypothetical protein
MISVSFEYGPIFSSVPELNHAVVWFRKNYGHEDAAPSMDKIFPVGCPNAFVPINPEVRLTVERRFSTLPVNFRAPFELSIRDFAERSQ